MTRLRVVGWNVHGCVGVDRRFDPARIARVLVALAPDVALLQEVGDNRGVHPPMDQATTLARALGLTCTVGITLRSSIHGFGNVTLSRFAHLDADNLDLSVRGREPRVGLAVTVGDDRLRLDTLNVHLGLGPDERRRQLRALLPRIDSPAPLVMGGDFNDFPPGPVSFTLRSRLRDATACRSECKTFPSVWPLLRLDRIYLSQQLRLRRAFTDRSPLARAASDHLPVVVDCDIEND
jgi:endonuclease/exonuclease/phosphatase family metal-dependent hydrolase